jgi:uncharacterized membrane protein
MRAKLSSLWDRLRASYWFVPTLMAIGALLLAYLSSLVDERIAEPSRRSGWIYSGGPEGARAVLGAIAGSLMTMASLVFSITIVALTLASQQFGPRLLRNFMRDIVTQTALGTFTATFLFCLIVLRTIRGTEDGSVVPHFSVTVGVVLAVASLAMLIYFIHHVSTSIQVTTVISGVSVELVAAVDRLFPTGAGADRPSKLEGQAEPPDFDRDGEDLPSPGTGYLQIIDLDELVETACRHDVVIRLDARPGKFVAEGATLGRVHPAGRAGDDVAASLQRHIVIGDQRTLLQDVEFGVAQLVEVALRALSPGVNDPFTAISCIDQLAAALCRCARAEWPPAEGFDQQGHLRLVAASRPTFEGILGAAFDQLRQTARGNTAVTMRLLEALALVGGCCRAEENRSTITRQAEMIFRGARESITERSDLDAVEGRFTSVMTAVGRRTTKETP